MARVIVVGAGVAGLTSAVRLAEAGHRVDVLARDLPRETTSAVAAALWYPYLALPQDRVTAWAARSYGGLRRPRRRPGDRRTDAARHGGLPDDHAGPLVARRGAVAAAGHPDRWVCRPGTPTAGRSRAR